MEVEGSPQCEDTLSEFTLAEIIQMENLFKKMREKTLNWDFCQDLADRFSCSNHRIGKSSIKWEQVHSWFEEKQMRVAAKVRSSIGALKDSGVRSNAIVTLNKYESSSPITLEDLVARANIKTKRKVSESSPKPKAQRVAELSELVFEAKSAKDWAWYDVASFLNYRVLHSGELEVRVRFAGFNYHEDEWVSVRSAVRDRSIPLQASECHKIKVGDLVLCYKENDDLALYTDAYVTEIERRLHDTSGCECIFGVRYDYDDAEAKVRLSSLCCRP